MAEDIEQQVNAIFPPQRKVYCGTCHYYMPGRITQQQLYDPLCQHPNARQEVETYEGVVTLRIAPESRNHDNDCTDWEQRRFLSDISLSTFKQAMLLLAAFFLLAWFWKMVM